MTVLYHQVKVIKSDPYDAPLRSGNDIGQVHTVRGLARVVWRCHCAAGNATGGRRWDSCPGQLEPFVQRYIPVAVEIDINPVSSLYKMTASVAA